jgi:uncharacterized protein
MDSGADFSGVEGWEEDRGERNWTMLCHLATFSGCVVPLGNILVPLAIWWAKRDTYPLVREQGLEVVNFQISLILYLIGAGLLSIVLIGLPILFGLLAFDFIITIVAIVRASDGRGYRYPLNLRLLS